jgi:chemotaxis response regulator CheB
MPSPWQVGVLQSLADATALAFTGFSGGKTEATDSRSKTAPFAGELLQAQPMADDGFHRLIVIGASAGGIDALLELLPHSPADLPAPICVVVHTPPRKVFGLPAVLNKVSPIGVHTAEDGEPIRPCSVALAPPDHHLLVERGALRLVKGVWRTSRGRRSIPCSERQPSATAGEWWQSF